MDLSAIQQALRERNIDACFFTIITIATRSLTAFWAAGWAHGHAALVLPDPAKGDPIKLVHKIESGHLDTLPGTKKQYAGWQELFDGLKQMLAAHRNVAMQYSPNNFVSPSPWWTRDGDMIRGLGRTL